MLQTTECGLSTAFPSLWPSGGQAASRRAVEWRRGNGSLSLWVIGVSSAVGWTPKLKGTHSFVLSCVSCLKGICSFMLLKDALAHLMSARGQRSAVGQNATSSCFCGATMAVPKRPNDSWMVLRCRSLWNPGRPCSAHAQTHISCSPHPACQARSHPGRPVRPHPTRSYFPQTLRRLSAPGPIRCTPSELGHGWGGGSLQQRWWCPCSCKPAGIARSGGPTSSFWGELTQQCTAGGREGCRPHGSQRQCCCGAAGREAGPLCRPVQLRLSVACVQCRCGKHGSVGCKSNRLGRLLICSPLQRRHRAIC